MSSIDASCSAPSFVAQKGRKLLVPVPIFLFGATGFTPPPTPSCHVRVTFVSSSKPGTLSVQEIPGMWTAMGGSSVRSASFDPNTPPTLTAFLSFLDPDNLTAPDSYTALYRIEVFDDTSLLKVGGIEFPVTGNATPAQSVKVIFALDHGFTMGKSDAARMSRLNRLKAAFSRAVALFRDDDTFGFVSFANPACAANPAFPLGPGDVIRQNDAKALAAGLTVDLSNPLTKCIQTGIDMARGVTTEATLVILTDGTNINPPGGGGLTKPTLPTSALIIIENAAAPPASATQMISDGGHYAIATLQTLGEFAIEKLLTQILIGLAGNVFISDPEGSLKPGERQRYPIHLTEADRDLELIVFSNDAEVLNVDLVDRSPHAAQNEHGRKRECEQNRRERDKGVLVERISLPPVKEQLRPHHEIEISRVLRPGADNASPVRFNLLVVAKTDLMLDAQVASTGMTVGSELLFSAVLSQFGHAWEFQNAKVHVELTHPDGFLQTIKLDPVEHAKGRFEASLRSFRPGSYTAHFIAEAKSLVGRFPFRRECLRTIAVFPASECSPRSCSCN